VVLHGRKRLSRTEFDRLPRAVGWTYHYQDGVAVITPRHAPQAAVRNLASAGGVPDRSLVTPAPADLDALCTAFAAAFSGTPEYAGSRPDEVRRSGRDSLCTWLAGRRGEPRPESRALLDDGRLRGAILLVQTRTGPHVDLLFVSPTAQRRHCATRLMETAFALLRDAGCHTLTSSYDLNNRASRDFHWRLGFEDLPDTETERLRRGHAISERERRQSLGNLSPEEEVGMLAAIGLHEHTLERLREQGLENHFRLAEILAPARISDPVQPIAGYI